MGNEFERQNGLEMLSQSKDGISSLVQRKRLKRLIRQFVEGQTNLWIKGVMDQFTVQKMNICKKMLRTCRLHGSSLALHVIEEKMDHHGCIAKRKP